MKTIFLTSKPYKGFFLFLVNLFLTISIGLSQPPFPDPYGYLMIVDIQSSFYTGKSFESMANQMVQEANKLIGNFDPSKVIYIKAGGKVLSISGKGISTSIVYPDLDSNLNLVSQNIFTKIEGDAFTSEELSVFLNRNNAKKIYLIGLMAEKCIQSTALGGKERGFEIILIPKAIIGTSEKKKVKALKKMSEKGVSIM